MELKNVIREVLIFPKDLVDKKHFISTCPFCGKPKHFYISYEGLWDCKRCGEVGNIFSLLRKIGRLDLYKNSTKDIEKLNSISLNFFKKSFELEIESDLFINEKIEYPRLTKDIRMMKNLYLNNRGFSEEHYEKFKPKKTIIEPYNGYVIIPVTENTLDVAYVCRNTKSNYIRYRNSESEFSKFLFDIDSVENDTVIIVEGLFGKINLENILRKNGVDGIDVVASFGKKLSNTQLFKLYEKGVKNLNILYDEGTVLTTKNIIKSKINIFQKFNTNVLFHSTLSPDEYENIGDFEVALENATNYKDFLFFVQDKGLKMQKNSFLKQERKNILETKLIL